MTADLSGPGPHVPMADAPVRLLMPGQSAMLDIAGNLAGNGHARPVSVAPHGEEPVGAAVKCVIRVELQPTGFCAAVTTSRSSLNEH